MERRGRRRRSGEDSGGSPAFFLVCVLAAQREEKQYRKRGFTHFTRGSCDCYHILLIFDLETLLSHPVLQVTVRMTGCAKRCKQGIIKFALSLHKLVTGTLNKGMSLIEYIFTGLF